MFNLILVTASFRIYGVFFQNLYYICIMYNKIYFHFLVHFYKKEMRETILIRPFIKLILFVFSVYI